MKKGNYAETVNGVASTASTECTNQQQWTKYHSKQGHGFAAEDANALWDKMHGKRVDKVGMDNSKNGADRIVNGVEIQTKYCANATKSVDAAFENGQFRYSGMNQIVPAGLVNLFKNLIREGGRHGNQALGVIGPVPIRVSHVVALGPQLDALVRDIHPEAQGAGVLELDCIAVDTQSDPAVLGGVRQVGGQAV